MSAARPGGPPDRGRREEERESIWSVEKSFKHIYFSLFTVLVLLGAVLVVWKGEGVRTAPDPWVALLAFCTAMAPVIVTVAPVSLIVTEIVRSVLFLSDMLQERLERMREARRAEGRAEGRAETNARWETWNNRRLEAAARGEPFQEPPPSQSE